MKNITFTAEASLITKARERATREHRNLNVVFREWLSHYALGQTVGYDSVMESLSRVRAPGAFTRTELNER